MRIEIIPEITSELKKRHFTDAEISKMLETLKVKLVVEIDGLQPITLIKAESPIFGELIVNR